VAPRVRPSADGGAPRTGGREDTATTEGLHPQIPQIEEKGVQRFKDLCFPFFSSPNLRNLRMSVLARGESLRGESLCWGPETGYNRG
jgi:hypothetical protein